MGNQWGGAQSFLAELKRKLLDDLGGDDKKALLRRAVELESLTFGTNRVISSFQMNICGAFTARKHGTRPKIILTM